MPGGVPDYLPPTTLDLVLVGINPGLTSARRGRHYAHHTNHFYRCLHLSGLTNRLLRPEEDELMPYLPDTSDGDVGGSLGPFRVGLTNLSPRPTREMSQLTVTERRAAVQPLFAKLVKARPKAVGFVGKGIAWDSVRATPVLSKRVVAVPTDTPVDQNGYGLMPYCLELGEDVVLLFALPSTSARVTSFQLPGKAELFACLRKLVAFLTQTGAPGTQTKPVSLSVLHAIDA